MENEGFKVLTQNLCSDETPNPESFRFIKFMGVMFGLEISLCKFHTSTIASWWFQPTQLKNMRQNGKFP